MFDRLEEENTFFWDGPKEEILPDQNWTGRHWKPASNTEPEEYEFLVMPMRISIDPAIF